MSVPGCDPWTHTLGAADLATAEPLTPEHLLHDLYGSRALVHSASIGHLTRTEREHLYRPRANHVSPPEEYERAALRAEVYWAIQLAARPLNLVIYDVMRAKPTLRPFVDEIMRRDAARDR